MAKATTTIFVFLFLIFSGCNKNVDNNIITLAMKERQISFSQKNHALDNNDNFSPDNRFLCYDTRGTVYNENLANCKSIEKIEIASGKETVLWEPESVTGEQAAPGVAAVSWHPKEDKVIFIHGPLLDEVEDRGFYAITNRTGIEVSSDGKCTITKVDMRDVVTERPTIAGAQRGGTHRHEYTRKGNRIGFTYDDFIKTSYDRTIGYMEPNAKAPTGYTHYFAVILKPAEKGLAKPGEIEKAYGDSWVDAAGTMRAFIGKVMAENGVDYQTDLFVADIPENVDITTANSGNGNLYPEPPAGIKIRRLTHSGKAEGIVRGSYDGSQIAYLSKDETGIKQIFVIDADGSDLSDLKTKQPRQLSHFDSDASSLRWHPSNDWVISVVDGNVAATFAKTGNNFGKTIMLTNDDKVRSELVISNNGKLLAYTVFVDEKESASANNSKSYRQIFVMETDWNKIDKNLNK
jgi:hypothetical protein